MINKNIILGTVLTVTTLTGITVLKAIPYESKTSEITQSITDIDSGITNLKNQIKNQNTIITQKDNTIKELTSKIEKLEQQTESNGNYSDLLKKFEEQKQQTDNANTSIRLANLQQGQIARKVKSTLELINS